MVVQVVASIIALIVPIAAYAAETDVAIGGATEMPVGRMVIGLAFCLGVLMFGVAIARKYGVAGTNQGQRRMKIIERLAISTKSSLVLINIDGVMHCIAVGSERVTSIADRTSGNTDTASFLKQIEEESCGNACTIS